jgi:membrane-associated phospholipid phosphatase
MYDALSTSTILLIVGPIIIYIFSHKPMYLMLGLGTLVAGLSAEFIKRFVTTGIPEFKRPKGARACDALCRGGSAEHESGMPSAHAASTAFAATYIVITCNNPYISSISLLYWLAVCYSRYKKRCHTPAQLLVGTVLGVTLGWLATKCQK